MSDALKRMLLDDALEAAEFQRLKKSGHFLRNAERLAEERAALPREVFAQPSVALLDRSDASELVAEPNDAGAASLRPLADFDDAIARLEDHPGQLRFTAQWAALLEVARRDTGDCGDPQKRREAEQRKAELLDVTLKIAANIEERKVARCLRQDEIVIWLQGAHSGIMNAPVRFYSHMMLPYVQAQKRQRDLLDAAYFLQSRPHARNAVFTTGPRTKLRAIGQRIREMNRNLSTLNHEIRKAFRIEMVLRSDELGTPEYDESGDCQDAGTIGRDLDGEPTFHVHAHVILHHLDNKPLSREDWQDFLAFVSERWGYWWKDCGVLRDAAEVVKYITKPREIEHLTGDEQAVLFRQLQRVKLFQTMGELAREKRSRKARQKRLDRMPTPEGRVLREIDDWNCHARQRPADAEEMALQRICGSPGDPYDVEYDERPVRGERCLKPRIEFDVDAKCTAILPPGFLPGSHVRESIFVMMGKRIDRDAWKLNARCVALVEETRPEWLAGVAASRIMVHTCTPTVGPVQAEFACASASEHSPPAVGPPE